MYATIEDVLARTTRTFTDTEKTVAEALLEDAAVIIDAYNASASEEAKKVVSCNMVIRAIGDGDTTFPIGSTQGSMSALGYSQSFTMGSGSTGELYLTKIDKKLLGAGNKIGFVSVLEDEDD